MGDLAQVLADLDRALVDAGHPLADLAVRPAGRSLEELHQVAHELLEGALPDELVTLWGWWGSSTWPAAAAHLGVFEDLLPGGIRIASLEESLATWEVHRDFETLPADSESWLPVMFGIDDVVIFWCDRSPNSEQKVAIQGIDIEDPDPFCEVESIEAMFSDMVTLLDERLWVTTQEYGWHYAGDFGAFDWIS